MPKISPQVRAQIGGTQGEAVLPRASMKISTGMNPPAGPAGSQPETKAVTAASTAPVSGQQNIQEETTPAVTLSPQLTALARKQQKLQSEIAAQKAREAEFEAKQSDFIPKSSIQAKLRANPVEALKDLGLTYEEITDALLNQQQGQDPYKRLESEIEQIKKSQEENVNKQYDATIKQYRAEADQLVASEPKAFHLILKGSHQDAVVQHIVETWQENPDQVLTIEQAAKEVEEYLREDARAKAALLKELEPPTEETPAEKRQLPPPQAQRSTTKTLTRQAEASPTRVYGQFQHLSMKERIAQAMARAQK